MKWPLAILCLLMTCSLWAQWQDQMGYMTHISAKWGFENTFLNDIQEDWNGFIWIGTDEGLYRFDGTAIKHYTYAGADTLLPHNQVLHLMVDEVEKELWISTAKGICRFDPAKEQATYYQWEADNPHSLADDIVRYVLKDRDGTIWVACYNYGLSRYRPETDDFENYFFELAGVDALQEKDPTINESRLNSFRAIAQDVTRDHILWLGGPLGPIRFDRRTGEFRWLYAGRPEEGLLKLSATTIFPQADRILVGTPRHPYFYYFESEEVRPVEVPDQLRFLYRVTEAGPDEIWLAFRRGMLSYDLSGDSIRHSWIDEPQLDRYYSIRLQDRQGRIWVHGQGETYLYDPVKQVASLHAPTAEPNSPFVAIRPNKAGHLVALTRQGRYFHTFDPDSRKWTSRPIQLHAPLPADPRWMDLVPLQDGRWLLLGFREAYLFDPGSGQVEQFPIDTGYPYPAFTAAVLDRKNRLWVSTRRVGLFRVDLDTREQQHFVDELNSQYSSSLYTWISQLHEDQSGNVWVRLARSYAVYLADKDRFRVFPHYEMGDRTFRYVRNFAESPAGEMWVTSEDRGFGPADLDDGILRKFTTRDGLLSDVIYQIEFDGEGRLWNISDKGLSVYLPATGQVRNYPWDRGIPRTRRLLSLENGQLALILPEGGLALLEPSLLDQERLLPQPYITRVKVGDQVVFEGGNRIELTELELDPGSDYLTIEFSALGYSNPKDFAYRLEGVDEGWVETNDSRSISYSNLSPGDYTFALRARLEGGEWSEARRLEFYLAPHWWQTMAFRVIGLLWLILLAYALYRRRIYNIRREERLKSEFERRLNELEMQALRAQMNPHFLFNALNSIQLFIIRKSPKEAVNYLDRFARLIRLILQNSRSKFIPLKTELETLGLYLQLEKLRFKVAFEYRIEVAAGINEQETEVPPMLIQPFIENAIWHGIQHKDGPGNILLKIRSENEQLICIIEDDGIGRRRAAELKKGRAQSHQSMGVQITEDRLHMLYPSANGQVGIDTIDLYDEEGEARGTRVVIRMPK